MRRIGSLSHSRWECKYHVVFIPKYRKKAIFGEEVIREYIRHQEDEDRRMDQIELM
jgi:putative transposase